MDAVTRTPTVFSKRAGEIVATAVIEFEAQCPRLHEAPPLGALVRVQTDDSCTLYGVVAACSTEGVDMGARPVPRARDGVENADIYREHPDLVYVLRTCFRCVVVGYQQAGQMHQFLPPSAAPIHYSATVCDPSEVAEFTGRLDYLRILLDAQNIPNDEVVAAHLRFVGGIRGDTAGSYHFAVQAGKEVATLLRGDHQRLVAILQRIRPPSGALSPSMSL
jgi:hypothetical protein